MPKPKSFSTPLFPSGDEAVDAVINIMDRWFWDIEDGRADNRFPSPNGLQVTMDEADEIISFIDKEISYEVNTHTNYFGDARGMDMPADFNRLKGLSRIAFVQEILEAKEKLRLPRGQKPVHGQGSPTSGSIYFWA
jgi:hypothetical protein